MKKGHFKLPIRLWVIALIITNVGCILFITDQQAVGQILLLLGGTIGFTSYAVFVLRWVRKNLQKA